MSELFYLRDSRSNVGSSAMFWAVDGCGYTSNLSKAWKITREEAIKRHSSRESDVPVRCDLADMHSYFAVDCQLVNKEKMIPVKGEDIVYQVPKCWDGNNIMFAAEIGNSFDYRKAKSFDCARSDTNYIPLRKNCIDSIARPVVEAHLIEAKMVLRKAKIKMNPRLLKSRNRETTGKTRGNCPVCGKMAWDYNPYEPVYCKEHDNKWDRL